MVTFQFIARLINEHFRHWDAGLEYELYTILETPYGIYNVPIDETLRLFGECNGKTNIEELLRKAGAKRISKIPGAPESTTRKGRKSKNTDSLER